MRKIDYQALTQELIKKHNCHTIILYGSRADNTDNAESDIDILCFRESCEKYQDACFWQDLYLDTWIYPDSDIEHLEEFLRVLDGKILFEENNFGSKLLDEVKHLSQIGPQKMSFEEIKNLRLWSD